MAQFVAMACVLLRLLSSAAGCWPLLGEDGEQIRDPSLDRERAEKAPVIVVGIVDKAHKKYRDAYATYAIDFRIARVLKGKELINTLPDTPDSSRNVYRISNFGVFKWCFSDVHENQTYILFLQVLDDRLSAYYTRMVDAAEQWSSDMEDRLILQTQGYKPWGEWSGCSTSCGSGTFRRVRLCSRTENESDCEGDNVEKKECNVFACLGVRNLVELGGLAKMTKGVIRYNSSRGDGNDDQSHYDITPNFYGQIPAAQLFRPRWPTKYSVIVRIRPRQTQYPRQGQYLFSLADNSGQQYLGLKIYPYPTLEIRTSRGSTVSVPVGNRLLKNGQRMTNINDGRWHQFSFGVDGTTVSSYYGCFKKGEVAFRDSASSPNVHASALVLATRMFKMDRGTEERFEGTIDQLLITDDPGDASRQCNTKYWSERAATKARNYPRQNDSPCTNPDDEDCQGSGGGRIGDGGRAGGNEHWEWSVWSPCSRSCGTGKKTRTPYCLQNSVSRDDCIPYYVPAVHVKECIERRCPECRCENGGVCIEDSTCKCPKGWRGTTCNKAACEGGCGNGACVGPDTCECHSGWTGSRCDAPLCQPQCQNGGVCASPNICKCSDGYGGLLCSRPLMRCLLPCLNGGRCIGLNRCECLEGHRGHQCQEKVEPRCERPCANGGICVYPGNRCRCTLGYHGDRCERDACGGCRNGGVCNYQTKNCSCGREYTGSMCEYAVTPSRCLGSMRCLNGGQCIDYNACFCPAGYLGEQCQIKKCAKYRSVRVTKEEPVRKARYTYYRCPGSMSAMCRQFEGYAFERTNMTSHQIDLTQCDE